MENIYYAHTEIHNINVSLLTISKEYLNKFLEKNKHKDIQEIIDLLSTAEICIKQSIQKLDNVLDNLE
jgi:DNA-binding MarR family transcriptional regulator